MSNLLINSTLSRHIARSVNYLKSKKKFPILEIIFHNYDYWKILTYTLEAYEKKKPISKIDLINKIDCSYKTANKYIDFLVKKQIIVCLNKKNNNQNFNLRKIDYINKIDKRFSYFIPSLNLLHELNAYLKQGY